MREVLKHPQVERVEVCEIDKQVIAASREFLPGLGSSFGDERVEVRTQDGSEFMAQSAGAYDVILVDCSDPDGPAGVLFSRQFHENMKNALAPGGVAAAQCESFYLYGPLIKKVFEHLPELFPVALYYLALVPTYLSGIIGFAFASLGPDPFDPPRSRAGGGFGPTGLLHPGPAPSRFHAARPLPQAFAPPGGPAAGLARGWGSLETAGGPPCYRTV